MLLFTEFAASAANPTTLNFQGKVVNADGTNVTNGNYAFVFRLYNNSGTNPNSTTCALEATCLWEESQGTVAVTNGVFQVELGSSCPLFTSNACNENTPIDFNASNALYLTMRFNSDAQGYMTPMMHFNSVPYAFNADKLGGLSSSGFIQNTTSQQTSSNFNISGAGTVGGAFTANGTALFQNTTNSTTAFQIQNAAGISNLFIADTENSRIGIATGTPGNKLSVNALTTADSLAQVAIGTGTTTNRGLIIQGVASQTADLFQAQSSTGGELFAIKSNGALRFGGDSTTDLVRSTTGVLAFNNLARLEMTGSLAVKSDTSQIQLGGARTTTITHRGSANGGGVTIEASTAAGVPLVVKGKASQTADVFRVTNSGDVTLASIGATGAALFKNSSNSATAFQVQNAISSSALHIDTTILNSFITNGNFEGTDVSAWTAKGTAAAPSRDTARSFLSAASLTSNIGTASGNGIKYTTTSLSAATTYALSFTIQQVSGTALSSSNFAVGWNNDSTDTDCTLSPALTTQAPSTSGWVRYTCTFTGSTSGHIYWKLSATVGSAVTLNIDSVQLEQASSTTGYKETGLSLNGLISSPVTFQNISNSTAAFQVQNASGLQLFIVDSLNSRVYIGNLIADTTGTLLVLDTKTDSGDPTGVNGGLYYNSNVGKFRCFEANTWKDCMGDATPENINIMTPANALATWTDQPAALTELFGTTQHRVYVDMTNATQVRLIVNVETASAAAGAQLCAQYSTDGSSWSYLDGSGSPCVATTSAGTIVSSWINLAAGAKGDYRVRIAGSTGGASTGDPAFGAIHLQIK